MPADGLVHVDGAPAAAMDPAALTVAFDLVRAWVATGVVPGAAALVWCRGCIAGECYAG